MICGQSRPRPAPPVKMNSPHVRPVSSVMMPGARGPRRPAASSMARTQAPRPEAPGRPGRNWRERRAGVRPALSRSSGMTRSRSRRRNGRQPAAAVLLHHHVGVDARARASRDLGVARTRPGTSACSSRSRSRCPRASTPPGTAVATELRSRIRGSMSGSASSTVFCQKRPGDHGCTRPAARPRRARPSWVSPPPAANRRNPGAARFKLGRRRADLRPPPCRGPPPAARISAGRPLKRREYVCRPAPAGQREHARAGPARRRGSGHVARRSAGTRSTR